MFGDPLDRMRVESRNQPTLYRYCTRLTCDGLTGADVPAPITACIIGIQGVLSITCNQFHIVDLDSSGDSIVKEI